MLAALGAVMNRISSHFEASTLLYDKFIDQSGARVLISKLREFAQLKAASGVP